MRDVVHELDVNHTHNTTKAVPFHFFSFISLRICLFIIERILHSYLLMTANLRSLRGVNYTARHFTVLSPSQSQSQSVKVKSVYI